MRYQLLKALLIPYPIPIPTDSVARLAHVDPDKATLELARMLDHDEHYGPLVELCKHGWRITGLDDYEDSTGGRGYLREAAINPYYAESAAKFKNEALTRMTEQGKESKITNAALPSRGAPVASYRDPEDKAMRTNQRLTTGKGE